MRNRISLTLAAFLAGVLTVALGLAVWWPGQPATAQAPRVLKMEAAWPAGWTLYDNFTMFAERVEKLSGGSLKIETLPAGAIVPPFELLDAVHKKVVDGAHIWAGYWVGKNKAAVLFTGGPGGTHGMDFMDAMGWLYEGGGLQLYREMYQKVLNLNVEVIPILPSGPQALGWFKRPIKDLADFRGLKCRETGLAAEVFTAMGMRTVNMPGGEILPAAERGVIDCGEWVGGIEDLRAGFHNIWKYHYAPSMHESVTIGELLINGDVWKSLSPQHREIMQSAATETFLRWWIRWQHQNGGALKEMQEKHGVHVLQTPPEILTEFLKAWDKIANEEAKKNPFFKKVWESQKAYASIVVPTKRFYFPNYELAADHYWPRKK